MKYLKGTKSECESYDATISNGEGYPNDRGTLQWMLPIERDGDFYIRKHPDYPATTGLTEADLPPDPEDTDVI